MRFALLPLLMQSQMSAERAVRELDEVRNGKSRAIGFSCNPSSID